MFGIDRMSPAAAAAGLVVLAALVGCGGETSFASESAAAVQEAPDKGETPESGQEGHAGHEGHEGHAGHGATPSASPAAPEEDHTSHSAQDGHGAHDAEPQPEVPSPGQPASTLRPDPIDAPAATSVADAQRSAEMTAEMAGGHGGHGSHGTGGYRHVDAGRGPGADQAADEPQSSGADAHQHHHASESPGAEGGGGAPIADSAYVCPMHSDVTSEKPGTCPRCGMALVPRNEE